MVIFVDQSRDDAFSADGSQTGPLTDGLRLHIWGRYCRAQMLLGHLVGGLALFGASIQAAAAAVVVASLTGVRHPRRLVTERGFRVVQLGRNEHDGD